MLVHLNGCISRPRIHRSGFLYGTVRGLAMPVIDLPDDELAAVTAALRGVIKGD
jgi:hypothetical protein